MRPPSIVEALDVVEHILTKTLNRVSTEMGLHVLAYNMKRAINLLGAKKVIEAI
jgi:hypothetical protein